MTESHDRQYHNFFFDANPGRQPLIQGTIPHCLVNYLVRFPQKRKTESIFPHGGKVEPHGPVTGAPSQG
jgi:hypothetical protein